MCFYFLVRDYPSHSWPPTEKREETPLMLIATYNKGNQPIKESISKYWPILDKSSATKPLTNKDIMVTFKKPESIVK